MARKTIHISVDFPQPLSELFSVFSQHEKLARVLGVPMKTIVPAADPSNPSGVGSVRRISLGPVRFEETVTGFEKDRVIHYRISKGGFMKHHDATMRFTERAGGSHLDHRIEIESAIPFFTGPLASILGLIMGSAFRRFARRAR